MHWIWLISFIIVINIGQSQLTTSKDFETGNVNKGGNNVGMSESKNNADGSVHAGINNVPLVNSIKNEKDGRNTLKYMPNSGNNNYCYIVSPFIMAALMTIVHF